MSASLNAVFDHLGLVLLLVAAPFIGSFLGVVITRLPAGQPMLLDRSRCATCGHTLAAHDLVPLISWATRRGRCRYCGARIGLFSPMIEIAALGIAGWAATETSGVLLWITAAFGWTLLVLAVIDWRHFILPDRLVLPLVPAGLAVAFWIDRTAVPGHLLGALAGLVVLTVVAWAYRRLRGREGLGFGDAKLFAGAGAWLSWQGLPSVLLLAALMGLAGTLLSNAAHQPISATTKVCFGSYLCAAIWLVWLYGPVM